MDESIGRQPMDHPAIRRAMATGSHRRDEWSGDVLVSGVLRVSLEDQSDEQAARDEAERIIRAALAGPDEIVIEEITVEEVLNNAANS